MIGILSQGRMGNQMFQYAFGYSTSRKINKKFFIYGHNNLHYFKLYKDLKKNNKKNILFYILNNLFTKNQIQINFSINSLRQLQDSCLNWGVKKNIYKWTNTFNHKDYFLSTKKNNTLYQGFFQSEKYFESYKKDIQKLFEIRQKYKIQFLKNKKYLFDKKCIVVHLRRADYLKFGDEKLGGIDITLPTSYYKKCLDMINNINNYNVIFVSDDIDFAKKEFGFQKNYFFESNDEITDLQILLNANILIIANSTFSWWGAWLNEKKTKIVYAPNYFLGFKVKKFYPAGIKINHWNWIDVN